eukprot:Rhum_TRINITY_DN6767_c0_g1::Rhum_TRINITY_DN6767_c0_g1_i1::g.20935::m.20935
MLLSLSCMPSAEHHTCWVFISFVHSVSSFFCLFLRSHSVRLLQRTSALVLEGLRRNLVALRHTRHELLRDVHLNRIILVGLARHRHVDARAGGGGDLAVHRLARQVQHELVRAVHRRRVQLARRLHLARLRRRHLELADQRAKLHLRLVALVQREGVGLALDLEEDVLAPVHVHGVRLVRLDLKLQRLQPGADLVLHDPLPALDGHLRLARGPLAGLFGALGGGLLQGGLLLLELLLVERLLLALLPVLVHLLVVRHLLQALADVRALLEVREQRRLLAVLHHDGRGRLRRRLRRGDLARVELGRAGLPGKARLVLLLDVVDEAGGDRLVAVAEGLVRVVTLVLHQDLVEVEDHLLAALRHVRHRRRHRHPGNELRALLDRLRVLVEVPVLHALARRAHSAHALDLGSEGRHELVVARLRVRLHLGQVRPLALEGSLQRRRGRTQLRRECLSRLHKRGNGLEELVVGLNAVAAGRSRVVLLGRGRVAGGRAPRDAGGVVGLDVGGGGDEELLEVLRPLGLLVALALDLLQHLVEVERRRLRRLLAVRHGRLLDRHPRQDLDALRHSLAVQRRVAVTLVGVVQLRNGTHLLARGAEQLAQLLLVGLLHADGLVKEGLLCLVRLQYQLADLGTLAPAAAGRSPGCDMVVDQGLEVRNSTHGSRCVREAANEVQIL